MLKRLVCVTVTACLFLAGPATAVEEDDLHPLDAHLSDVYTVDLPGLLERKYIRVLTTMNRTNFFLAGGKPHGFEYALLKEYEEYLNKSIQRRELSVTLEFIPVSRDRLLPGLVEGIGDIAAAGLTDTEERRELVDFTRPYLTGVDELLVTHKNVPAPESLRGLSRNRIFVRKSSSYYESIRRLNQRLDSAGLRPVKIVPADENLETEDILELVNTGAIHRTVADSHIARIWAEVLHDTRVRENIVFRSNGRIAWAVRKDSPKLKESLDRFLKSHRKGTLLGNIFFKRYYENNEWVKNPFKGDAGKRIEEYRPLFEKYAERYGFDWRLVLAMAYQESGLNHQKKSHRGAVGLMQIRPSTAADPQVGIKNIYNVENNIHAGVKYLDFLRNRYFSDEKIAPRDRVRFSLSAYNAGPAKIRHARKEAVEMGLDSNRWFRNVELAVLRIVGRETVGYVSSINKYYVIYTNALARREARERVKGKIR